MQALPYAGFPRVFATMTVARRVLDDRGLLPVTGPSTIDPS